MVGRAGLVEGVFFEREEMEGDLREAGFAIEVSMQRAPSVEVEVQIQRVSLLARKLLPALIVGCHKDGGRTGKEGAEISMSSVVSIRRASLEDVET